MPSGLPTGPLGVTEIKSLTADKTGPTDGLYYRAKTGTEFTHPNNFEITMDSGEMLVSVRKPSHNMLIENPFGTVSGVADADAIIKISDGVIHVFNMNVQRGALQVKLDRGHFAQPSLDPILQISPGFELVASDHKLTRADVRPPDGIGRKNTRVMADGYIAVSTFSLESLLNNSEMIADMNQQAAGTKEKRIVSDLSKMAAVLNYVNGAGGFEATAKTK